MGQADVEASGSLSPGGRAGVQSTEVGGGLVPLGTILEAEEGPFAVRDPNKPEDPKHGEAKEAALDSVERADPGGWDDPSATLAEEGYRGVR